MAKDSDKKHPDYVLGFEGTIEELAKNIGNTRYDILEDFLTALADDISRQADGDKARGREKLAGELYETARRLYQARDAMQDAWNICEPYMRKK